MPKNRKGTLDLWNLLLGCKAGLIKCILKRRALPDVEGTGFLLALNSWIRLKAWVPPFSLVGRLTQTARGTAGEFARTEIRRALLPTWGLEGLAMAYNQFKFCTVRGNAPRKSA